MGAMMNIGAARMRALPLAMLQGKLGAFGDCGGDFNPGWQRNLLTYSQDLSNAAWVKQTGASIGAKVTAPDGTLTADTVSWASTAVNQGVYQVIANMNGFANVKSVWVRADVAGGTVRVVDPGLTVGRFDHTLTTTWQRITFAEAAGAQPAASGIWLRKTDSSPSTIYVWGAQVERGTAATDYQKITDAFTEYTAAVGMPTLWKDSTGIQPVTALEQFVGLVLDKTQINSRGPERVNVSAQGRLNVSSSTRNGDGWDLVASGVNAMVSQTSVTTGNARYEIAVRWSGNTAGRTLMLAVGGAGYSVSTASSGSMTLRPIAASGNNNVNFYASNSVAGDTFYFEITSIRMMPGIHLHQPTNGARGVLSARFNMLIATEALAGTSWSKVGNGTGVAPTVTDNYGTAPDGTQTAARIQLNRGTGTTSSDISYITQSVTSTTNASTGKVWMRTTDGSSKTVTFRVGSGTFNYAVSLDGNWQLVSLNGTGTIDRLQILLYGDRNQQAADILVWHPDLRLTADTLLNIPAYQRVTTATDYDYQGFPCFINGAGNKWYLHPAVDVSSTDKLTPFAGVTKLASGGMIMESSANAGSTAGAFYLYAPSNYYEFRSAGSAGATVASAAGTGTAPHTAALVGLGNISGDSAQLRVNGTPATPATTDQGTGNYTSQPFYLLARAGTSLFFNGRLFYWGLLGENASQAFLENLDRWSKQRMKVAA